MWRRLLIHTLQHLEKILQREFICSASNQYSLEGSRRGHSIVKLNTTCGQNKFTFGKLHHQNESKFYQFFFHEYIYMVPITQ